MLILALDSSTKTGAVSLCQNERIIAEYNLNLKMTHSQRLMPQVVRVMEEAQVELNELDGIAVGVGPGSFTGIRIGVATAKSLAQVVEIPIVSVSTLEVLANSLVHTDKYICPVIDARRERVYTGIYKENVDGLKKQVLSERMIPVTDLVQKIGRDFNEETIFVGEATDNYGTIIKGELGKQAQFLPSIYNIIRGGVLGRIGSIKLKAGEDDDLFKVNPNYLKRSQAEIDWERRLENR
ncbi:MULTISPECIES: tRNA (adenosine(37)-N6)-threonylcarbamoyltransferase complex dimerization subunit type 1 TsaB [unclassified Candidatus Frackibacter]|uniref:tRNA (adenosine(37)-N6)-threonylcarbamoyltransferase complex dimerization subunit type 1 TsaB n=1 Tax=unclassified Candidatus Frackibacter TaxID=2648818 RepID=UPI00088BCBE8|nr:MULTISPECIES: tRNA (adenosine(37)-N6)-threonylcarbamoyltransferase complex dimerization subunit type 1 TsaB [unclassified Candidatus Frackibacter]SDC23683.1 tRNA threonylcarbamoyladenosine biosynthesis protein TsaB [Candidatus Frackibacter sp. WG11]SEM48307.1 tRNA threonylcarbamoyladenosine biosynthesis protein TsaB [Candidatus Frackibacter sp. WG12]SFL50207.1 tRNA threonylcarbamoyladenosine biosynthesis protein TsaB [Candidatus Frackibacter sp. WG13]